MADDARVDLRESAAGAIRVREERVRSVAGAPALVPFRDRGGQDFWPGEVGGLGHLDPSNVETGCLLTNQITGRGVNSEANRRKEIVRESLHRIYIHFLGSS